MKLVMKKLLVILLITNLSSIAFTKESSSKNVNTKEKLKNSSSSTKKTEQVIVNTVRTHHYEEADEAPPGSIASRVIPNKSFALRTPVAAAVPTLVRVAAPNPVPRLVSANEWSIPFPVVRPGQVAPPVTLNRPPVLGSPPGAFRVGGGVHMAAPLTLNRPPVLGSPPGAFRVGGGVHMAAPVRMVNVGGVPPMPVPILKPGITRVVQFPQTGSSFNTNYEGNIDSIDDLKISSKNEILFYFV